MNTSRVIIIGAGIAGVCTAYYLNRAGYDVTLIEKSSGSDNCSYGNAGMIVPSHIIPLSSPGMISKGLRWMLDAESPFYIRPRLNLELLQWLWKFKQASTSQHVKESGPVLRDLLMASRDFLIQIEREEEIEFSFEKKGLFMFCNTDYGLSKEIEIARKAIDLGIPAEILSTDDVKKMDPQLDINIIGATYYPNDAHLHPGTLMDKLKSVIEAHGVRFSYNTEVTGIETSGGKIEAITTADGQIFKGGIFVNCAGAWSASLMKIANRKLLMQAGKGYSITIENPAVRPEYCGILSEKKVTFTPMYNSLRFAGTMEIVGTDTSINYKKIKGLKRSVLEYLPQFKAGDLEGQDVWTGLRPCSPDGLPYVGAVAGYSNFYTSTGHAMMGMSLAPSAGKLLSDLITYGKSDLYSDLIDPNRFGRN